MKTIERLSKHLELMADKWRKQRLNDLNEKISDINEAIKILTEPAVVKTVCNHENKTWNEDAGCMVCDECNERC